MTYNTYNNTHTWKAYVKSERWKCPKSPTGSHYWLVNEGTETCRFCDAKRKTLTPDYYS